MELNTLTIFNIFLVTLALLVKPAVAADGGGALAFALIFGLGTLLLIGLAAVGYFARKNNKI